MATVNSINNTIGNNDFSVNRSTAGTAVESSTEHSDNTNTSSHARLLAQVGGASGGDPYLYLNVLSGQDYSFGIDNSDSDALKIQDDADPSTGNNLWKMTSAGERTMPLQPAFIGVLSGNVVNVTGNGTQYQIGSTQAFTEIEDQGGDFNTNGTFTAPVDGIYYLSSACILTTVTGTAVNFYCVTSNRTMVTSAKSGTAVKNNSGACGQQYSLLAEMDAADTATTEIRDTGAGADTEGVSHGNNNGTYFTGNLVV